jgi:ATP-dependent Clp endopeptidase proteolytic subunit ClpP
VGKSWFEIKAKSANKEADVFIYDEIGGFGVTAKDFAAALKSIPKDHQITLRINSPGGSVVDGAAIYNLLAERSANIVTKIDGLAASMASVIALAGSKVLMADNALMMIHDPIGWAFGDSEEMRKTADVLDKFGEAIVNAYQKKTGKPENDIKAAMAEETWFTAAEAKEFGLVDEVSEPMKMAAKFDLQRFRNAPAGASAKAEAETPPVPEKTTHKKNTMDQLLKALVASGLIPSTKLDDTEAAAAFNASWESYKNSRKADAEKIIALETKIKESEQKDAEDFVAKLVAEGKIKDEPAARQALVSSYLKDKEGVKAWTDAMIGTTAGGSSSGKRAGQDITPPRHNDDGKRIDPNLKGRERMIAAFEVEMKRN